MTAIERTPSAPALDPEEARRLRNERLESVGKWVLPLAIMAFAILMWDRIVVWNEIPKYILPRPGVVLNLRPARRQSIPEIPRRHDRPEHGAAGPASCGGGRRSDE